MTREEASFILANIDRRVCDDELNDALDMAIKALEQEPKTGHWLFPYGDKRYKKCSVCGRIYYSIPHDSNYCPNCGAKMESEDKE